MKFEVSIFVSFAFCSSTVFRKSPKTLTTYLCSTIFLNPQKKARNASRSALILFLINLQDSEVSKMVCIAIVARLDPTH